MIYTPEVQIQRMPTYSGKLWRPTIKPINHYKFSAQPPVRCLICYMTRNVGKAQRSTLKPGSTATICQWW